MMIISRIVTLIIALIIILRKLERGMRCGRRRIRRDGLDTHGLNSIPGRVLYWVLYRILY
jgi:hypothetical protein